MYLTHFQLHTEPFGLTPNTDFYCNLPSYQEAFNVLNFSIDQGSGFIKIIGEVGYGKTLICRKLINSLQDQYVIAYIPNPTLTVGNLHYMIAQDLGIDLSEIDNNRQLSYFLTESLIKLHQQGKKVLIVIDEAQALSDETLEALRLLSNIETESEKLLQIVLFAQPELDVRLENPKFRQLKQRILFSYYLRPLTQDEIIAYINHRLVMAGYTHGNLFNKKALNLLYKKSKGIPRLINNFCYKSLLVTYGQGAYQVNESAVQLAVSDSFGIVEKNKMERKKLIMASGILGALLLVLMPAYNYFLYRIL